MYLIISKNSLKVLNLQEGYRGHKRMALRKPESFARREVWEEGVERGEGRV